MRENGVIERLISLLRKLPGVGTKTAFRYVFAILASSSEYGHGLSKSISDLVDKVHPCAICGNLTESPLCSICENEHRDHSIICVVENVLDLIAVENTHEYKGVYHVLGGVLNPLNGVGPQHIRVQELMQRLDRGKVREVILATSSNVEGEATVLYLKKCIAVLGIKVSRIASGIPVGGELEYVDRATIARALCARQEIK
jgi:recombination protein RecR